MTPDARLNAARNVLDAVIQASAPGPELDAVITALRCVLLVELLLERMPDTYNRLMDHLDHDIEAEARKRGMIR